ncbi:site-2 protease family protein [Candidatus Magnetominusculus dajiuhuensis]|uniref:site-2 protease family protein n=1 Tax=Candidatus Magnetominusculus dajiuhuensis TaxID=3137712 RepID=UPI003B42D8CC
MADETPDIDSIYHYTQEEVTPPCGALLKGLTPLHVILFVATLLTTLLAGMLQKDINPLDEPWRFYEGLPFALTLLTILMVHELAHYYSSIRHHTAATLPYFIPAPLSPIGTFGAFIKMKSPIRTRTALMDIGASGPIAGFIISIVAVVGGLFYSEIGLVNNKMGMVLGDSLLFSLLTKLIVGTPPQGYDVMLSPVAFAGWLGFFVTSLNLIPIGQLDGGHIMYAFAGGSNIWISRVLVVCLALMGIEYWNGWLFWAALMVVLGLRHPPVIFNEIPLEPSRKKMAAISLAIFIVTFVPMPFRIME